MLNGFVLALFASICIHVPSLCHRSHSPRLIPKLSNYSFLALCGVFSLIKINYFAVKLNKLILFFPPRQRSTFADKTYIFIQNIFLRFIFYQFYRQGNLGLYAECHQHESQTTFNGNTFQTGLVGWKRRYIFLVLPVSHSVQCTYSSWRSYADTALTLTRQRVVRGALRSVDSRSRSNSICCYHTAFVYIFMRIT